MAKWERVRLGDVLDCEQLTKYIVQGANYYRSPRNCGSLRRCYMINTGSTTNCK